VLLKLPRRQQRQARGGGDAGHCLSSDVQSGGLRKLDGKGGSRPSVAVLLMFPGPGLH